MFSLLSLAGINLLILLAPPKLMTLALQLVDMPSSARMTLFLAVTVNVALSLTFEQWGVGVVSQVIEWLLRLRRDRKRWREGQVYKRVERGA